MSDAKAEKAKKLRYYFVKSNDFRVIYAEGAFGGVSPKGAIRMTLFNERFPLPQETIHEIRPNEEGGVMVGPELTAERVGKVGIIREMEADIVLSLETARVVHQWIGEKIQEIENIQNKVSERHE